MTTPSLLRHSRTHRDHLRTRAALREPMILGLISAPVRFSQPADPKAWPAWSDDELLAWLNAGALRPGSMMLIGNSSQSRLRQNGDSR